MEPLTSLQESDYIQYFDIYSYSYFLLFMSTSILFLSKDNSVESEIKSFIMFNKNDLFYFKMVKSFLHILMI
jgi:hypothetical protein